MSKRKIIFGSILLPLVALSGLAIYFITHEPQLPGPDYACPFCNEEVINKQVLYHGNYLRVWSNRSPIVKGHLMIIPKRHAQRIEDWNAQELTELNDVILRVKSAFEQAYGTSDFVLVLQNGIKAGQTVHHSHFHVIPKTEYNLASKVWLWMVMLTRPLDIILATPVDQLMVDLEPVRQALQQ